MEPEIDDFDQPWERVVGFAGPSFSAWADSAVFPKPRDTFRTPGPEEQPDVSTAPAPGSDGEPMQSSAGSETLAFFSRETETSLFSLGHAPSFRVNLFDSELPTEVNEALASEAVPGVLRDDPPKPTTRSSDLTRDLRRSAPAGTPSKPPAQTVDPSSEQARQMLLARANKVMIPSTASSSSTAVPSSTAGPEAEGAARDPTKLPNPRTSSPSILIPDRADAAARRARASVSQCLNHDHGRVLRWVPEPPAAPTAVTAPAVVQLLLASQAAATAEHLYAEQMACCRRNNLKKAYEYQERLRVVQAQLEQLEADVDMATSPSRLVDRSSRGARSHQGCNGLASAKSCDWAGWYAQPHGNIAAADYCSGLDDW